MEANPKNIGIIAGGGQFPLLFIEAARKEGRRVVVVGHKGETDEKINSAADAVCWVKLGQLGKIISFFKKVYTSKLWYSRPEYSLLFSTQKEIISNITTSFFHL